MTRCPNCPQKHRCLPPSGPQTRGGILLVGEAPGKKEEKQGVVFTGPTGEEVNRHYLPLAGLRRETVCFTNAVRCLPNTPGHKLDPDKRVIQDLIRSCAEHHLYPLIEVMKPSVIVPMGQVACQAVFGEPYDLDVKHGIPAMTPWDIPAFPMFHPALGLHEPKKMLYIRTDWHRLKAFLDGTLQIPEDPYPTPDYREVVSPAQLGHLDPVKPLAFDTESGREGPYCLTYSQAPGTGWLIRAERRDLLDAFQARLDRWTAPLLVHNWLYDWNIVEAMGLRFPLGRIIDTMVRVYHLGNLPQGLKALAYRELGMAMSDFVDVVGPHSRREVVQYYEQAATLDWGKPEPELVRGEGGKWKLYKAQGLATKFKRFFTDLGKNPAKDVFQAWANWEDSHTTIEAVLGPWPGMDIRHVPFAEALVYACRDADATLRLWSLLQQRARRVRRGPQETWGETSRWTAQRRRHRQAVTPTANVVRPQRKASYSA